MSAPSPNDLFMNVWVSRINSEEMAQPGDEEWDPKQMKKFWGRVWMECKELSQHLQSIETTVDQLGEIMKEATSSPAQTQQQAEDIVQDLMEK